MAEIVEISAVPCSWRLENFIGNNEVACYTGSSCTNGIVFLLSGAIAEGSSRLGAVVMTGKGACYEGVCAL